MAACQLVGQVIMGTLGNARQRLLAARGRPMTLHRISVDAPPVTVTVVGTLRLFNPQDLTGAVKQGDARIEIGHDEIAAASWPLPPSSPDQVLVDGQTYSVQGAMPVCDGPTIIGWSLHVRGGG